MKIQPKMPPTSARSLLPHLSFLEARRCWGHEARNPDSDTSWKKHTGSGNNRATPRLRGLRGRQSQNGITRSTLALCILRPKGSTSNIRIECVLPRFQESLKLCSRQSLAAQARASRDERFTRACRSCGPESPKRTPATLTPESKKTLC